MPFFPHAPMEKKPPSNVKRTGELVFPAGGGEGRRYRAEWVIILVVLILVRCVGCVPSSYSGGEKRGRKRWFAGNG